MSAAASFKVNSKAFLSNALAVLIADPGNLAPVSNIPETVLIGLAIFLLKLFQTFSSLTLSTI